MLLLLPGGTQIADSLPLDQEQLLHLGVEAQLLGVILIQVDVVVVKLLLFLTLGVYPTVVQFSRVKLL